jgi:mannose-1-phosphate guanylyltransferase
VFPPPVSRGAALSPPPPHPLPPLFYPPAAGPLALAREHLDDGSGEPFFVFNSDVTCDYPLRLLLDAHKGNPGAEGTLLVTRVAEPSKYGVVVHKTDGVGGGGMIQHFVEKPQTFVGNHINAGLYCLSPSILARIPAQPTSIEKEVFPFVAEAGKLFALPLPGYWMDIGQPQDYITGTGLHLASLRAKAPGALASGPHIVGNVLIHPSATVAPTARLGPDVVVGEDCVVEDGARLNNCSLLRGARVKAHALVLRSIVGWASTVGRWARVEGGSVLGEDVAVGDEVLLNGALVLPHKALRENIYKPQIIM